MTSPKPSAFKSTALVNDFVASSLEPGELIEATLSFAETGPSYWLNVVRAPIGFVVPSF